MRLVAEVHASLKELAHGKVRKLHVSLFWFRLTGTDHGHHPGMGL